MKKKAKEEEKARAKAEKAAKVAAQERAKAEAEEREEANVCAISFLCPSKLTRIFLVSGLRKRLLWETSSQPVERKTTTYTC